MICIFRKDTVLNNLSQVATEDKPALVVDGLTKKFGRITAVEGLTFTMPRGGIIGFVGPNGAGKSTTIRMILGLIRPTKGSAEILGHGICKPHSYIRQVGALVEAQCSTQV